MKRNLLDRLAKATLLATSMQCAASCATVGTPQSKAERKILRSVPFVRARHPGKLVAEKVQWRTPEALTASVQREVLCEDAFRDTVETTVTTSYETRGVELDVGLGLAGMIGGAVGVAVAPSLSDAKSTSGQGTDQSSPRTDAYLLGGTALITGAVFLGHGLYAAIKGQGETSDPVVKAEVRAKQGALHSCGLTEPGAGQLTAVVGTRRILLKSIPPDGQIAFEPRSVGALLCNDIEDTDRVAEIEYSLDGTDPPTTLSLGQYELANCVRSTVALVSLERLEEAMAAHATSAEVASAIKGLVIAAALGHDLPVNDPDRDEILSRVEKDRQASIDKARQLIGAEVQRAVDAINVAPSAALEATAEALSLAVILPDGQSAWETLWGTFFHKLRGSTIDDYLLADNLLKADPVTKRCAAGGDGCPTWLTSDLIRTTALPLLSTAATLVDRGSRDLAAATRVVQTNLTLPNLKKLESVTAGVEKLAYVCHNLSLPFSPLKERCVTFGETLRAKDTLLAEQAARIGELQRRQAELERQSRVKRVAASWRKHFADCRRLRDAIPQLERLDSCGADCQVVVNRMRLENERLRTFHIDEVVEDADTLSNLQRECQSSGCQVCP